MAATREESVNLLLEKSLAMAHEGVIGMKNVAAVAWKTINEKDKEIERLQKEIEELKSKLSLCEDLEEKYVFNNFHEVVEAVKKYSDFYVFESADEITEWVEKNCDFNLTTKNH